MRNDVPCGPESSHEVADHATADGEVLAGAALLDSNGEEIDPMSPLGEYTFNLAKSLNAVFVAGMNAEREGR